jgi:hypothetical protein
VGSFSDHSEKDVLDWMFGGATPTRPAAQYLALFTTDPTDTGAAGTELSLYGYARQAITFGAASGTTPCQVSNTSTHTFTNNGGGSWGTIAYWAIFDASTAGNMLASGAATTSRTIAASEVLTVAATAIVVTLD